MVNASDFISEAVKVNLNYVIRGTRNFFFFSRSIAKKNLNKTKKKYINYFLKTFPINFN